MVSLKTAEKCIEMITEIIEDNYILNLQDGMHVVECAEQSDLRKYRYKLLQIKLVPMANSGANNEA